MGVLAILLGHEQDGQIDEVLQLAHAYDEDESSFRFRCVTYFSGLLAGRVKPLGPGRVALGRVADEGLKKKLRDRSVLFRYHVRNFCALLATPFMPHEPFWGPYTTIHSRGPSWVRCLAR